MNIIIGREPEELKIEQEIGTLEQIEAIVNKAAAVMGPVYDVENSEVSITLTNDEYIHKLNLEYRGLDRPTDVLSFAFVDSQEPEVAGGMETEILGDIIISVERAYAQAQEYGHSLERELSFLTVHGMLHLLGYDHMEEEDRVEMEEEQRFVMEKLGVSREAVADMKLPLAQEADVVNTPGVEIKLEDLAPAAKFKVDPKTHQSGFVAVIGRPNVGKSTLINSLIGQKIAIMSDKPQTTRNRIMCVLTQQDMQVVFLDTPGIHKPKHKLGEYMVKAAEGTLKEVDAIIFVVDANEKFGPGEQYTLDRLQATKKPVILAINKVDLIEDKEALLPIITSYNGKYDFIATVPISAKEESNLDGLVAEIKKHLPKGPQYYPEDMVTDQPERLIVAELIREKALHNTREEIPHAIAVDIEEMKPRDNGDMYVRATIYVERDSQKGIVIGKRGALLKEIGAQARADIQMLLGCKVFLDLWVKVKKDWRNRDNILKDFGFQD